MKNAFTYIRAATKCSNLKCIPINSDTLGIRLVQSLFSNVEQKRNPNTTHGIVLAAADVLKQGLDTSVTLGFIGSYI